MTPCKIIKRKDKNKMWTYVYVKKEFSRFGIPEMVGIYYNPYNKPAKDIAALFILPEFMQQVYYYNVKKL